MSELRIIDLPWYDRNPKTIDKEYLATSVVPHDITERFSYIVPSNRRFQVGNAFCLVHRYSVATVAEQALAKLQARGKDILVSWIQTNNIGDKDKMNVGKNIIMQAGEKLQAFTLDGSTDGTVGYGIAIHGIEFDAITRILRKLIIEPVKPDIQEPEEKPWWWPF